MAEKTKATHALRKDKPPRILSSAERADVDRFVLGIFEHEMDELGKIVRRVCAADRMDPTDGILVVADVRGAVGAWLLKMLSEDKVSAEQYANQASRDHRFAPIVAQFWSEAEAGTHLPKIAPGALESVGARRDNAVRAVLINKSNQSACAFIDLDEDGPHA